MKISAIVIPLLCVSIGLSCANVRAQSAGNRQITDMQSKGNLQSNYALGCIAPGEIRNVYTPADLYKAVAVCVMDGNMENGAMLYTLAAVYGRFDSMRVSDDTAHQAIRVIQMQEFDGLPQDKKDRFKAGIGEILDDGKRFGAVCAAIRKIGPPDYRPDYMIQHGMGAFSATHGSGLVVDFDETSAWREAMETYVRCPAA